MGRPKGLIQRAAAQQFFLGATVCNAPFLQHHDLIRVLDGGEPVGDDQPTTGGDTANGAEADNPYVNSDGQLIDPTTGEVITEDSDGYDVPVSGILENGAAGNSGGDTQNPME